MIENEERQQEVRSVLVKFVAFAAATVLVLVVGTVIIVKSLDLNSTADTVGDPAAATPIQPLPTKALPQPHSSSTPTDEPTDIPTDGVTQSPGNGDLFLNASPVFVNAMERINLTGQWPGHDAVGLLVQRFEDGEWVDFGVQVQVRVGTFETYVMTGREGDNKFRLFDPETNTSSNEVVVTVGT